MYFSSNRCCCILSSAIQRETFHNQDLASSRNRNRIVKFQQVLSGHGRRARPATRSTARQGITGELATVADIKPAVGIGGKAPGVAADLRSSEFGVSLRVRLEQKQRPVFGQYQKIV